MTLRVMTITASGTLFSYLKSGNNENDVLPI